MPPETTITAAQLVWYIILLVMVVFVLPSIRRIGPTEVGLVTKRFALGKLQEDNPIAFKGEAGYQADLLMPGLRFKFWVLYSVRKFPWVQIPAGEIGVVIAQAGQPLPIGAKSAVYKPEFGNFADLRTFIDQGGQKGVQRPVLPPGTLVPVHPVAFLIRTKGQVYGVPISEFLAGDTLRPEQFELVRIEPAPTADGRIMDRCGIVTTYEGDPLPSGDIASRLGGFSDLAKRETQGAGDSELIDMITGTMNSRHNNYQDLQAFLDGGGKIGLQHDPLLYGAFALNPYLVSVEMVPMLVVKQGQVAVVKAYVGLATEDTSGSTFKFGSIVRPGHRGIWQEPLRTGKYPLNPRCYEAEIVPTSILTLNWAEEVSQAHNLDRGLSQIVAKSNEGFVFKIDLQVQIHVPDTKAPRVISMVGTMQNLVNEVLQAAVGNHFRDQLQSMPAIRFIETRQAVQESAMAHISTQLGQYEVETRGVYIQDVILPEDLVRVLTQREIANQEIKTYAMQQKAEEQRTTMAAAKGTADMQNELARAEVGVQIKTNNAEARKKEGEGEAAYVAATGTARGAEVRAVGLAKAEALKAQQAAIGEIPTAIVNIIDALAKGNTKFVPDVLVAGGSGGSALEALASALTQYVRDRGNPAAKPATAPAAPPKA